MYINGLCSSDKKIWFTTRELAAIFELDRENGRITALSGLEGYQLDERDAFGGIINAGEKIVVVPFDGNDIFIYDIRTKDMSRIPIREYSQTKRRKYANPIYRNGCVWVIGRDEEHILKLSLDDRKLCTVGTGYGSGKDHAYWNVSTDDDSISVNAGNKVYTLNMMDGSEAVLNTTNVISGKCSLSCRFQGTALFAGADQLVAVDGEEVFGIPLPEDVGGTGVLFSAASAVQDGVILFPCRANSILKVDPKNRNTTVVRRFHAEGTLFSTACSDGMNAIAYNCQSGCIEIYDKDGSLVEQYGIHRVDNIRELIRNNRKKGCLIMEGLYGGATLEDFIDSI